MLEELRKRSSSASNTTPSTASNGSSSASGKKPTFGFVTTEAERVAQLAELQRLGVTNEEYWNSTPELTAILKKAEAEKLPPKLGNAIELHMLVGTLEATREMHRKNEATARLMPVSSGAVPVEIIVPRIFSSKKIEELERISVSELMIRKTHKGRFFLCKIFKLPLYDLASGILLAVKDPEGNPGYVKLFNYSPLIDVTQEERESILPVGRMLAIREPTYANNPGVPALPFVKVDTPSDVILIADDNPSISNVHWRSDFTTTGVPTTGEEWRASALKSFKSKRWYSCAIAFTNCIKLGHDLQVSRLNRSEAYLRLGWYNSAYHDSKDALDSGTLTEDLKVKAVVRMMKAKYALQRYDSVLEISRELPNEALILEWKAKASQRVEEQTSGNFDWITLFKEDKAQTPPYTLDRADYTGPVEVKTGSKGLRGMFVTSDVKAGDLLLVHKPIVNWTPKDNATQNLNLNIRQYSVPTLTVREGRGAYLFCVKAIQSVWDNRNLYETILSLAGGPHVKNPNPYPPPLVTEDPPLEHPTIPVVDIDIEYIEGAIHTNSFQHSGAAGGKGLYALASLMNHSCLPSAHKFIMGGTIVVRANRDMKKGDEVTVYYINGLTPYHERQYRLKHSWKFACTCKLCEADGAIDQTTRERRIDLAKKLSGVMKVLLTPQGMDRTNLKRIVGEAKNHYEDMKKTYSDSYEDLTGGVKFELSDSALNYASVAERLGRVASDKSMMKLACEVRMESLDLAGVKVVDRSMSGPLPSDAGKLPIEATQFLPGEYDPYILTVLLIAQYFDESGDKKRAKRWCDAALWVGKVLKGGGKEIFKIFWNQQVTLTGNAGRI